MTPALGEISPRQAAVVAGVGYAIIFVLAIFANFFVRTDLLVPGDAAATAAGIRSSVGLFRAGIAAFLVVFVVDVIVAWALYVFFRKVHADLSLLAAWFRLVYTVLLGVALVFFYLVLRLQSGAALVGAFEPAQVDAQSLLFFEAFNDTWLIGLVAFGLHLLVVGFLLYRSRLTSRFLGLLLMVAGLAYVTDTLAHTLLADYADYASLFLAVVAVPSIVGELWLGLWLLLRAGRQTPAAA